jgi:short-subunit dehydrogenase
MTMTQRVLITGAGSGIGRELTREFLRSGARVLAVSLLLDELHRLTADLDPEGERLEILQMDLSVPGAAAKLFAHCEDAEFAVDTLINNAGFACYGDATDLDAARVTSMLQLNVIALTELSMLFGRQMKERRRGRILNVGSTAGMVPTARFASYGASKAYVNGFSYALRAELAPYGVGVTCLTPGAVATNFARSADILGFTGKSMMKEHFIAGKAAMPEEVAAAAIAGLKHNRAQVLVGNGSRLAAVLSRLIPQRLIPSLMKGV